MLPAAPGLRRHFDAAVIFGVKAIGGTESAALSYLILLRFMLFVPITVVGLVVLLTRYGGVRSRAATSAVHAPAAEPSRLAPADAGARAHSSAPSAPAGPAGPAPSGGEPAPARTDAVVGAAAHARCAGPDLAAASRSPRSRCCCPSTPTYDPWAWILWGRQIAELDLVTEGGPSWKPLPMIFIVPVLASSADDLAPYLWLWIAARRRAARVRDGLPPRAPAHRAAARRRLGRASSRSPRCSRASSTCATPRSATPSR